jgi:hypothetical protein
MIKLFLSCSVLSLAIALPCGAQQKADCSALPDAARLRTVLQSVVKEGASKNGGLGNQEWAAEVNGDGIVCAIVFSGASRGNFSSSSPRVRDPLGRSESEVHGVLKIVMRENLCGSHNS